MDPNNMLCLFASVFNMVISKLFLFLMQFLFHILIKTGGLPLQGLENERYKMIL